MDGSKERQGDFVFSAKDSGEYRFCFNNEMSTFAEKMVDFEIAVSLGFLGGHGNKENHPFLPEVTAQGGIIAFYQTFYIFPSITLGPTD